MAKLKKLSNEEKKLIFEELFQEVEEVLNGEETVYRLSKKTGVPSQIIFRYRNKQNKTENMTILTFRKMLAALE